MPGTLTPGQMFDHTEIELSGRSMSYPLDFASQASQGETIPVMQGGLLTLDDNGQFVTGLGAGVANGPIDGKTPMALIAIQGRDEFDANSDVGNISGGVQSGLVASGGYEIDSTEFVADTYLPNEPLTFAVGEDVTAAAYRGLITKAPAKYSTVQVMGVVSRGVRTNADEKQALAFWSVFCPAVNNA